MARAAAPGVAWVAAFLAQYMLTLRPTMTGSDYMAQIWSSGFPPTGAGPMGTAVWLVRQLKPLSANPLHLRPEFVPYAVASVVAVVFWALAAAGVVVVLRRRLDIGLTLAVPVLTATALGVFRVVPLSGRLVLWLVPLLFLAVAFAVDAGVRSSRLAIRMGAVAAAGSLIVPLSIGAVQAFEPDKTDDRSAIAFIRAEARPGDLFLFVTSATRAAEWYDPGGQIRPLRAVISVPLSADCPADELGRVAAGHRRIVAYAGVRFAPYLDTHQVLEQELTRSGRVVTTQRFGTEGVVWIVELGGGATHPGPAPAECLVVR